MAWIVLGGIAGFVLGSMLSHLLFAPRLQPARPPLPPMRRDGNPGAAFLLTTVAVFGGVALGGMVAGTVLGA
jgi:hypothetical protein